VGPHQIAATTRGIRIAAVSRRRAVPEFIFTLFSVRS
jgi:hypothetical protein